MKTAKFFLSTAAILAAILFNSCDKAKEKVKVDVSFNMNVPTVKLTIDTISQFGDVNMGTATFQSNLQKTLDDNRATIADIESISLESAQLSMVNPGSQNFNIIDKLYGSMSATGLAETRVAFIDPVPSNATQLTLSCDGANIAEYIKQSNVNFKLSGHTNGPNTQRDTLNVQLVFNIKAKVAPLE